MSQGFPKFDELYKTLLTSIIAFSSSGIVAISLIAFKNKCTNIILRIFSFSGIIGFSISILIIIISTYIALKHFSKDGENSDSLDYREINKKSFKFIKYSLLFFFLGLISFITILLSVI